jgi:hypothetical protein
LKIQKNENFPGFCKRRNKDLENRHIYQNPEHLDKLQEQAGSLHKMGGKKLMVYL